MGGPIVVFFSFTFCADGTATSKYVNIWNVEFAKSIFIFPVNETMYVYGVCWIYILHLSIYQCHDSL